MNILLCLALLPVFSHPQGEQIPASGHAWEFGASINTYWYPDDSALLMPVLTADFGALHLEGRYNYEAEHTGSLFGGYIFGWEGTVSGEVIPMAGVAFGDVSGIAPGCELDLLWGPLEFYTEAEYLFDLRDAASGFFYAWSELAAAPTDWLRAGLVAQRTRIVDTPRDLQRGILVGGTLGIMGATVHVFNPDDVNPYYVFTLDAAF